MRESQPMLIHQVLLRLVAAAARNSCGHYDPRHIRSEISKKTVHITSMKDDGGEQYLRLPTAAVVVVTAKTYHKMLFMF
ncbi:hypothetical protein HID58_094989 [Brassica napus]|uniref:Secreted protein n=1 Tax=Brassica napus TaxID=3708 RepID=A0ABQ7X7T1_BRANA|nr:hypothetical protein HID58_094989 [Brassica napus]